MIKLSQVMYHNNVHCFPKSEATTIESDYNKAEESFSDGRDEIVVSTIKGQVKFL